MIKNLESELMELYKCSPKTVKSYNYNFQRVCKQCNILQDFNTEENINKVIQYCSDQSPGICNTLLNSYVKCLAVMKYDVSEIQPKINNIIKNNFNDLQMSKATEKEKEKLITLEEVIKIRESHKKNLKKLFNNYDVYYVLLCLYTMLPPLRSQDYCNSYLFDNSDEIENKENYLCLTKKKLIIKSSKTSKNYGTKEIDIPDDLINILKTFKEKSGSEYVICSTKKKKLTEHNFVSLFKDAMNGKNISSSAMRKIFISEKVIDNNMKPEERKEVAKIMGHCLSTQTNTYSKYSKLLHTDDNNLNELYEQKKILLKQLEEIENKIKGLEKHNSCTI